MYADPQLLGPADMDQCLTRCQKCQKSLQYLSPAPGKKKPEPEETQGHGEVFSRLRPGLLVVEQGKDAASRAEPAAQGVAKPPVGHNVRQNDGSFSWAVAR